MDPSFKASVEYTDTPVLHIYMHIEHDATVLYYIYTCWAAMVVQLVEQLPLKAGLRFVYLYYIAH